MCRLRRTFSNVGKGVNQSCGGVSVIEGGSVSSEAGESDSMDSPVVMGCVTGYIMTNTMEARYGEPLSA